MRKINGIAIWVEVERDQRLFFVVFSVRSNTMTMEPAEDDYYCHYCACVYINKENTTHTHSTGLTLRNCGAIYTTSEQKAKSVSRRKSKANGNK